MALVRRKEKRSRARSLLLRFDSSPKPLETDDSAGELKRALMEVGASLVAGAESFELVEPGEGALDHPADFAQSGAVGDAASRDHGLDATLPQQAAVLVEVVAPVRVQPPRLAAGTSAQRPRMDGTASNKGRSWVTSCRLPAVSATASGVP